MNKLMNVYNILPVWLQNIMITAKGYSIQRERYEGDFKKNVATLNKSQWFSEEEFLILQNEKLKRIIKHAYNNVPYYRNLFDLNSINPNDINDVSDLKKIPLLDKSVIRNNIKLFVAKNIPRNKLIPHTTGGTTGTPLTIYQTKKSEQYSFAFMETRTKHWSGVKSGDRLATFLGRLIVPVSNKRPPFWRYNKAYNQILFSAYHMNDKNLESYVKEFNYFQPEIVQGYVSLIHTFARYINRNHPDVHSPKAILVSSETLYDWQRKEIEEAFHSRVNNSYGLAEFVAYISECEEGSLHICPEYGIVEYEKIDGSDDKFEMIATTLFNYSMPLIRYRTGDIVTLYAEGSCPCGRHMPIVKTIEGRMDSMIITPENNYISSAAMSLVFKETKNIEEAQLIQNQKDKIIVRIVTNNLFSNTDNNDLLQMLKARLGDAISIEIELVDRIEKTISGKYKFIDSRIN